MLIISVLTPCGFDREKKLYLVRWGLGLGRRSKGSFAFSILSRKGEFKKTLIIRYYSLVALHTLARVSKQSFLASNHYHLLHFVTKKFIGYLCLSALGFDTSLRSWHSVFSSHTVLNAFSLMTLSEAPESTRASVGVPLTCVCIRGLLFWSPLHFSDMDVAAMTGNTLTFIQAAVHMSRPMIAFVLLYVHFFTFSSTNCSLLVGGPLPVEVVLATRWLFSLG
jgi:hypothetical protein